MDTSERRALLEEVIDLILDFFVDLRATEKYKNAKPEIVLFIAVHKALIGLIK